MFMVTSYSQLPKLLRIVDTVRHEQVFAEFCTHDSVHVEFRKLFSYFKPNKLFGFEISVKNGYHKLYLWLGVVAETDNICDVKVFGLSKLSGFWMSIELGDVFSKHLVVASNVVKSMFDRVECTKLEDFDWDTRYGWFLKEVCQTHNPFHMNRLCRLLTPYVCEAKLVRCFRNRHRCKRAWYAWLTHYHSPHISNGYMYNKMRKLSCEI